MLTMNNQSTSKKQGGAPLPLGQLLEGGAMNFLAYEPLHAGGKSDRPEDLTSFCPLTFVSGVDEIEYREMPPRANVFKLLIDMTQHYPDLLVVCSDNLCCLCALFDPACFTTCRRLT